MAALPLPDDFDAQTGDSSGLLDPVTGWYRQWYAQLRLAEEIIRAERYKRPLSVVTIAVEPRDTASLTERRAMVIALRQIALRELRAVDLPGVLARKTYFVILPETEKAGADVVAGRLATSLAAFSAVIGVVSYPEDGASVEDLLATARP